MKTFVLCALVCLPALLLAAEINDALMNKYVKEYANTHPNIGGEHECEILGDDNEEIGPLNAITDRRKLWTDKTVYFEIQDLYSDEEVNKIRTAVAALSAAVDGCVKIKESNSAANRVVIRDCGGCSSYLGMIGGEQQMCLAAGCMVQGIIQHEFLHAIGFHHEQKRSDRDEYVYINFANIRQGTEHNFRKLSSSQIDLLGTKYDYGSVMHYGAYGFAVDRNIPTIIPLDPNAEIGQRRGPSALDIRRVKILYGC